MRLWTRFKGWLSGSAAHLAASPLALGVVLVALVAGVAVGVPSGEAGYHYVWRDPHFCNDCHVHDYADEAFFRSVHAELTTCHDCHRVPIMHYPRNLVNTPGMYGQEEHLEHRPHVESVICAACHVSDGHGELTGPMTPDLLTRIVKVDESPLHAVHLGAEVRTPGPARGEVHGGHDTDEAHEDGDHVPAEEGAITCMDCHGGPMNRAHRFEARRDNCLQCHEGISESSGRLSELQCQECHFEGFLGRIPEGPSPH